MDNTMKEAIPKTTPPPHTHTHNSLINLIPPKALLFSAAFLTFRIFSHLIYLPPPIYKKITASFNLIL